MRGWLKRLAAVFDGSRRAGGPADPVAPARPHMPQHFDVAGNEDILAGWRYCATLQLRTPLAILQHHNAFAPLSDDGPPVLSQEMWHGIWVPETKGSLLSDLIAVGATMASEIGQVPLDGGDYYHYLLAVREIVEGPATLDRKMLLIRELLERSGPGGAPFASYHGEAALIARIFPLAVTRLPVSASVAIRMAEAGLDTLGAVEGAGDASLLAIHGLGPKSLAAIRQALSSDELDRGATRFIAPEFEPLRT